MEYTKDAQLFGLKPNYNLSDVYKLLISNYLNSIRDDNIKLETSMPFLESKLENILKGNALLEINEAKAYLDTNTEISSEKLLFVYANKFLSLLEQKKLSEEQTIFLHDKLGRDYIPSDKKFDCFALDYLNIKLNFFGKSIKVKGLNKKTAPWKFAYAFLFNAAYERLMYVIEKNS